MGSQNIRVSLIDVLMNIGTKQVVGTLWPIDDHDAYDLMRRFFDQVKHQQSSPSKALQSAEKAWGQKHSPVRWASLVLHHH
jgi:CHAT domain-containing protein